MNTQKPTQIEYLVLAEARTGSTLLCELLEVNGIMKAMDSSMFYERLHRNSIPKKMNISEFKEAVENNLIQQSIPYKKNTVVRGFKIITNHFDAYIERTEKDIKTLLEYLKLNRKIICISRRDTAAQQKSFILAHHSGTWKNSKIKNIRIPITTYRKYIEYFNRSHAMHQQICEVLQEEGGVLFIDYEEIIESPSKTLEHIFEYLDIKTPGQWILKASQKKNSESTLHVTIFPTKKELYRFIKEKLRPRNQRSTNNNKNGS